MEKTLSSSFLRMSTELRLEVYKYLVHDCLATGHAHDIAGLYLSCHEVYTELESEHIDKVRSLLLMKHKWEKDGSVPPIIMQTNRRSASSPHSPSTMSVKLSVLEKWTPNPHTYDWDGPQMPYIRALARNKSFKRLFTSLEPVLALPWSALTLDWYDPTGCSLYREISSILFT